MPLLRDGSTVDDPRLGRMPEFDVRSLDYPVTARLGADQTTPVTTHWPVDLWLDQGSEGSCVGFGFAHEAAAQPAPVIGLTAAYAHDTIYWGTQRIDPWAGGSYPGATPVYEGTSVLSGAKLMTSIGFYTGYHWAYNAADVALAISYLGPTVLGVVWYNNMFKPDAKGFLRPTGGVAGGHCILAAGFDADTNTFTLHNSWGKNWGDNGTAKITAATLNKLLAQRGDACVPEGRQLVII